MQFRQENLHLREAWDALTAFTAPAGRSLSAFTQIIKAENGVGVSGESCATAQSIKADGVNHDTGPSAWSVTSDVVFCSQNATCMPSRRQELSLSTNGSSDVKPCADTGCGNKSCSSTNLNVCNRIEVFAGRITTEGSHRLWLAGSTMENRVESAGQEGMGCQRQKNEGGSSTSAGDVRPSTGRINMKEVHASDDQYNVAQALATSSAGIDCNNSDEYSESDSSTQKVYVPVLWLLNKEGGIHNSLESHCTIGVDVNGDADLSQLRSYFMQLLENERLVLIFLEI